MASAFVLQSDVDRYLGRLLAVELPMYQKADGLLAARVLRRALAGYEDIAVLTTWQSSEQMRIFLNLNPDVSQSEVDVVLIVREPPHVYQLVADVLRKLCDLPPDVRDEGVPEGSD